MKKPWDDVKLLEMFAILKTVPLLTEAPVMRFMNTDGNSPLKVLLSTIFSLRTRDEVTILAIERFFGVAETVEDIISLPVEEIEKLIYPVGFYRNKAKQIHKISHILKDQYDSKVPEDMELLLELPGVGRKTANLVMAEAFKVPAICVDIHVHRISNRLGICKTKTPEETEFFIREHVASKVWREFNKPLVALGQMICRPISPKCNLCPIVHLCHQKILVNNKKSS